MNWIIVGGLAVLLVYLQLRWISPIVSSPYMDEIFHIRQAQKYCNGIWNEYDPKLTTPPGLYFASLAILTPLKFIATWTDPCSTTMLRLTNTIFGVGIYIVSYLLLQHLHPSERGKNMGALVIAIFPVSFFFNLLYYTDSGSTLFVLLSYWMMVKGLYGGSSVAGLIAFAFRQSNIVWTVFTAGLATISVVKQNLNTEQIEMLDSTMSDLALQRRGDRRYILTLILSILTNISLLLSNLWPYLINILVFLAYLKWNGGIVLGDKAHHIASINIPQVFYFCGFLVFFAVPLLITQVNMNELKSLRNLLRFATFLPVAIYIISRYTYGLLVYSSCMYSEFNDTSTK
ncbi:dolichyl-P-Glc:Glc2Man9GlcNAc2-PP-dolichol alpha-1,2-glucosyltransferase [Synchytrium microbalum]|uniref:Dol-P-Glc:Glc(2)Man(9)GlcNAc(2)-PP-Dol alpha-1,2-glucosyltransferase n=1 Tax=Synchytrium microbalum TaxID=1806994 RepID=A0A507BTA5_9FUNG|nr:dolichyl-P-Glc:Glc2Man9GlcNAc2-PP-dolichol alpha-1,2-glucosyltransferase [Synchytrium microbalum]TPX30521.1 dolichyl-P-Glc:Glc2Man9GlcNAc2-PP-dolichol alpha-1,2-glucosyltransferase [Synchytrium microbalum]